MHGHEPSYSWDSADDELCNNVLRPRQRLTLRPHDCEALFRRLFALGRAANANADHLLAHAFFESAYSTKEDVAALLSATNMRFKLGQFTLVTTIYKRLLSQQSWLLTAEQRKLVGRKLDEASAAMANRAHAPSRVEPLQDELSQLLRDRYRGLVADDEVDQLVRLLRKQGHAANQAEDFGAARLWFDCCFALSRAPADLLSSANMRSKLADGYATAEVLYLYLFSLAVDSLSESERQLAGRKLLALRDQRKAAAAAAAATHSIDDAISWLDATAMSAGCDNAREQESAGEYSESVSAAGDDVDHDNGDCGGGGDALQSTDGGPMQDAAASGSVDLEAPGGPPGSTYSAMTLFHLNRLATSSTSSATT